MRHVIVTRFSVPRLEEAATARCHTDHRWLERRLQLFRAYFASSVGRLGVPTVLLCSSESAPLVASQLEDLPWAQVVVQNDWRGGWTGDPDQVLTRLDSDDAVHPGWFAAVANASPEAEVCCSKQFLRLDAETGRLRAYRRTRPVPLAAFRGGRNPYTHDHEQLERHYRTTTLRGKYLLQVYHGGNLSSRRPKLLILPAARKNLQAFGL